MLSISNPFRNVDYSALPPLSHYAARDGTQLAYRRAMRRRAAARAAAWCWCTAHRPTARACIRWRKASPGGLRRLRTRYPRPRRLRARTVTSPTSASSTTTCRTSWAACAAPRRARWRASPRAAALPSAWPAERARRCSTITCSWPLHQPPRRSFRPNAGGGWAVGVPRVVALTLLNRIGVTRYNHLPVVAFAVGNASAAGLVGTYSCPGDEFPARRNLRTISAPSANRPRCWPAWTTGLPGRPSPGLRRSRTARHPSRWCQAAGTSA